MIVVVEGSPDGGVSHWIAGVTIKMEFYLQRAIISFLRWLGKYNRRYF